MIQSRNRTRIRRVVVSGCALGGNGRYLTICQGLDAGIADIKKFQFRYIGPKVDLEPCPSASGHD